MIPVNVGSQRVVADLIPQQDNVLIIINIYVRRGGKFGSHYEDKLML